MAATFGSSIEFYKENVMKALLDLHTLGFVLENWFSSSVRGTDSYEFTLSVLDSNIENSHTTC